MSLSKVSHFGSFFIEDYPMDPGDRSIFLKISNFYYFDSALVINFSFKFPKLHQTFANPANQIQALPNTLRLRFRVPS